MPTLKSIRILSFSLLIMTGHYAYAEGGQHRDPLRAISGRHYKNTPIKKKTQTRAPGRHYSPLDALNGKIIVRDNPNTKKQKTTNPIKKKYKKKTKKQKVIYLDVLPNETPETPAQQVLPNQDPSLKTLEENNGLSALDILNGKDASVPKKSPRSPEKQAIKPKSQAVEGMMLPPETTKKKNIDLVVTSAETELPVGEHLVPLTTLPKVKYSPDAINAKQKKYHTLREKTLYLTFDDGPVGGTANLLRVLREEQVVATMFFIGREVVRSPKLFQQALAQPNLLIANHTYTHANNHYRRFYNSSIPNVVADIDKAQAVIGGAKYLRLCGRDVWRLPTIKRNDWAISVAQRGREVSKYDALYNRGYFIYGWDAEWLFSHKTQRPIFNGTEMARRVNVQYRSQKSATPGKVVLLAHDFMFRTAYNIRQLRTFIQIMKAQGWKFETIDAYSQATPEIYLPQAKKRATTAKLRAAQKLARKATVLLPQNKPTIVGSHAPTARHAVSISTQLSRAIRKQSFLRIRRLLAQGANINAKDPKGEIPLNIAIRTNNAVLVRMLVERGARIFNLDDNGMSPMGIARERNNTIIVRYLNRQIAKQKERRLRQTLFASNESIVHEKK